jgi:drug/metabolite transporter (DMT)-like permease
VNELAALIASAAFALGIVMLRRLLGRRRTLILAGTLAAIGFVLIAIHLVRA